MRSRFGPGGRGPCAKGSSACRISTSWSSAAETPAARRRWRRRAAARGRCLVERYGFLGGTATAAMVGPWMTFHSGRRADRRRDRRRRSSSGSSRSAARPATSARLLRLRPDDHAVRSGAAQGAALRPDARVGRAAAAARAGLDALRDAPTGARRSVRHRRRTARRRGRVTIDATADAFVAAAAGCALQQGDERGRVQPASLMFRLSHVDLAAFAAYVRAHPVADAHVARARTSAPPATITAVAGLYELWAAAQAERHRRPARARLVLHLARIPTK